MSTLTKILIVLLALSTIFLCGLVATYVGSAQNFRQKYEGLRDDNQSLTRKAEGLSRQLNEQIEQNKQAQERLNGEIAGLKTGYTELETRLAEADREKSALLQKVNSWTSITQDFYKTNDEQTQLLRNTVEELNNIQTEQVKQQKELKETASALLEKMAIIDTLETEKNRLLEEKTELTDRLDQLLAPSGQAAAAPAAVTPETDVAQPAQPAVKEIGLEGKITAVDMKNSMATISVGRADGVKEGMKFHVTRGEEFICDILIIDVDQEESAGALELIQQQPRAGDLAVTNF